MRLLVISMLMSSLTFLVSCGGDSKKGRSNVPLASTGTTKDNGKENTPLSSPNVTNNNTPSLVDKTKDDTLSSVNHVPIAGKVKDDTSSVTVISECKEDTSSSATVLDENNCKEDFRVVNNPEFIRKMQTNAILDLFPHSDFDEILANSIAAQKSIENVNLKTKKHRRIYFGERYKAVLGSISLRDVKKPLKFRSQYSVRTLNENPDPSESQLPCTHWRLDQDEVAQYLPEHRPGDGRVYCLDETFDSAMLTDCKDRLYVALISDRNTGNAWNSAEDKVALGLIVIHQKLNSKGEWLITF